MYQKWSKRFFDFSLAFFLLLLLSPCMVMIGILVRLYLGHPIFFRQLRPGLNEQPFYLYKFRTMSNGSKDNNGHLLGDKQRLSKFGKLLRSLSLDELPELINVLKGEMSLVGPRPLLMEYLPYYSDYQRLRHNLKPGITGWAQINGRNTLSWEKKFELDIWYIEHCSFLLDMKIIFFTIIKIIKREGIDANHQETMTRFDWEVKKMKDIT